MIKARDFDCFGVLYANAQKMFFERHKKLFVNGYKILDELNVKIDLGKMTQPEFFKALEKETGLPSDQIGDEIQGALVANQKLIDLIKKLKLKYKIGLLSNAAKDEIEVVYRDKLNTLFDSIIVSYKIGIVKPNPKIFIVSAKNLNVELRDSLFVDDSKLNVDTAIRLGMQSFLYTDFASFSEYVDKLKI